jgi:CRISPR/Cas system-associated exonuclease Cas4 (RecB family)
VTVVFTSPSAVMRQERALLELARIGPAEEVLVLAPTLQAADELARMRPHASFGWYRMTLRRLAGVLAAPVLAARGLSPASRLSLEALCVRIVRHTARGRLGRFASLADRPGFPRALARTIEEVRMQNVRVPDPDLAALADAYVTELESTRLADSAMVLDIATNIAVSGAHALLGLPLIAYDVAIASARERAFISALSARAPSVLVTIPEGDETTTANAKISFEGATAETAAPSADHAMGRLVRGLFSATESVAPADDSITVLSAPGESRECVEIARSILRHAERGVPFDRMAILLRSPEHYRASLEEALRRAGIPATFATGTVRPDPTGRALLSLLACAAEGLSARRFAEYLSLGEIPREGDDGAPPPPLPSGDRWSPPDEELAASPELVALDEDAPRREIEDGDPLTDAVVAGSLRTPRLWEKLLVDAAVIGGLDRWRKRLQALREERASELEQLEDPDGAEAKRIHADRAGLDALETYAIPLLEDLAAFPREATWGEWIERLGALATRALARPERVLSVLAELHPMADVGSVSLVDVRLALEHRLSQLTEPPPKRRYGSVYVAPIDKARGLVFDVVFVPGLAERLFPPKVAEDPLLLDRLREGIGLPTNADRTSGERLMLRLAAGAAKKSLVLSYPRLDVEAGRPRTPSFYALEVLRAAEGRLPGFGDLARRAQEAGAARIGWPAPFDPKDAIDEAEHDLALLDPLLLLPEHEVQGRAHYLLNANEHLARALRFRGRRWMTNKWHPQDGLVDPTGAARDALDAHLLRNRTYSPTALQTYAQCPYRFFLYAVHKLAPRKEPTSIEELDPLERGSLIHDVQFELYRSLRRDGLLPVRAHNLEQARARLDVAVDEIATRYKEKLAPAIERVWDDGIAQIRSDLRELLRRMADEIGWTPSHFELSFGLPDKRGRDSLSQSDGLDLPIGIRLRGSIDLVERRDDDNYRVTDYKSGKQQAKRDVVIGGGKILQPVLYALAVEKMLGVRVIEGRLYYCTSAGGFTEVVVPIDERARAAAELVARTVNKALEDGFLPAAPEKDACKWCDYRPVCGPYEETRMKKKARDRARIEPLVKLRTER